MKKEEADRLAPLEVQILLAGLKCIEKDPGMLSPAPDYNMEPLLQFLQRTVDRNNYLYLRSSDVLEQSNGALDG